MKDPAALVKAGGAVSAAVGGATLMGLPYDALFAGLCGGLVAMLMLRPAEAPHRRRWWAHVAEYLSLAGSLLGSITVAGFLGPLTAAWLDAPTVADRTELLGFSFLWGAGAQHLLVRAIEALGRRIDQLGGKAQ